MYLYAIDCDAKIKTCYSLSVASFRIEFVLIILLLVSCKKDAASKNEGPLRVLTYSSMLGEGSLGEFIIKNYNEGCLQELKAPCSLELIPEDGVSSLSSAFVKNKNFDAVLGLDEWQKVEVLQNRDSAESILFARSPHAIIVNMKSWPANKPLPNSWAELSQYKDILILQDPRVSVVGLGWLKAIQVHKLISPKNAKELVHKNFPSWSLSYSAFTKGLAPMIWSYHSSEAYHLCSGDGAGQFKALSLLEGYPQQEEWVVVSNSAPKAAALYFKKVLLSKTVQNLIAEKNYMFPAVEGASTPDCFKKLSPVGTLLDQDPTVSAQKSKQWIDEWSL